MDVKNTTPTFCVALTGGIGSGKTTTSDYFARLGITIIDADIISRKVCEPQQPCYHAIVQHFGHSILQPDKSINRQALRSIIFTHPHEKSWLEKLLHPEIRRQMIREIDQATSPYCICVIPLLAESTGITFIDRVLLVTTPIEIAKHRAAQRDNTNTANIGKIIDSQASEANRYQIADDILINDNSLTSLYKKIDLLHTFYLKLSQNITKQES